MAPGYDHLTLDERRQIFHLREARQPIGLIAAQLGRHRSTIYRELRRNFFRGEGRDWRGYFPVTANDFARRRRGRLRKLVNRPTLCDHVIERLRAGWSPQQIAGRLGQSADERGSICHETIYRYVYGPEGREHALYHCLPKCRRRRGRRFGRKPRRSPIPTARSIANRPAEVSNRGTFGHWECDLILFRTPTSKTNVTSLQERKSRYVVLLPNASRHSTGVIGRIGEVFGSLPATARQTITFDRGTEFMGYPTLAHQHSVTSYFCDPHSPWQKGAIENTNGRVRRHLPIGASQAALAQDALRNLAHHLNETPRRCLGYRTPSEVFHDHMNRNQE